MQQKSQSKVEAILKSSMLMVLQKDMYYPNYKSCAIIVSMLKWLEDIAIPKKEVNITAIKHGNATERNTFARDQCIILAYIQKLKMVLGRKKM